MPEKDDMWDLYQQTLDLKRENEALILITDKYSDLLILADALDYIKECLTTCRRSLGLPDSD